MYSGLTCKKTPSIKLKSLILLLRLQKAKQKQEVIECLKCVVQHKFFHNGGMFWQPHLKMSHSHR